MRSQQPLVREIKWLFVIPQFLALGGLIAFAYLLQKPVAWEQPVFYGCAIYLTYSYGIRWLLCGSHRKGIDLTHQKNYEQAIVSFQKSYEFFSKHAWIDKFRFIVLMTPSAMGYREMALVNIAFCYVQLGDIDSAKAYYQQTLTEFPDDKMAKSVLSALNSTDQQPDITK